MSDIFTKIYRDKIKEIHDFLKSDFDILYVSGFSGSGKSYVIKEALKTYENEILNFHHLCFNKTVTDDFLLSFYDTFRTYALKKTITLKKNPEEEFVQKVNFYFKNLEYPSVVVIDNYETVSDNKEIAYLLAHISVFENVKVIIISKKSDFILMENPALSIKTLNFEKINYEEFEYVLKAVFKEETGASLKELYNLTEGYELYLKMVLTYIKSVGISISELLSEFKGKIDINFNDFIIEKQVSLIPQTYYPFLRNLTFIHHSIMPNFINVYSLGNIKQIPYLQSKFFVSEFWGTYYIKSYLRRYFLENTNLQDKSTISKTIIRAYKTELEKSPKDRLLRMSRETIRGLISNLEENMPKGANIEIMPMYNYIQNSIGGNSPWFITSAGAAKKSTRLEQLKQNAKKEKELKETRAKTILQNSQKKPSEFENALDKAKDFENNYNYKEAIKILNSLKKETNSKEENKILYSKLSENLLKINDTNGALSNLKILCSMCEETKDLNTFGKYRIEMGKIYKKTYSFANAKKCFMEISDKKNDVSSNLRAEAKLNLGEIYELENNYNAAIKEYKEAQKIVLMSSGEKDPKLPNITYKAASLYDENGYLEEALEEYNNSIKYSEISGNTSNTIKSYANSGVIYADMGDIETALSYLKYALELSKNNESYVDSYYISRNIADIYKNTEPEKSYEYLNDSLNYAKLSDNTFEIAMSLLELGDYYYNSKQNEQALICYYQAKATLGNNASKEDIERVTTRINDMRIKLGEYIFKGMEQLYDTNN